MNAPAIMDLELRDLQAGQPHVLAVDDDPAMGKLIADYLAENDVRVTTVLDGRGMTEVLERETVDLVILDLRLRSEDGMDLMRELRAASTIPVIILTGRRDDADRIMGLEFGADDYLTKPFIPRELLARVRTVLRRRHAEVRQGRPQGVRVPVRQLGAQARHPPAGRTRRPAGPARPRGVPSARRPAWRAATGAEPRAAA